MDDTTQAQNDDWYHSFDARMDKKWDELFTLTAGLAEDIRQLAAHRGVSLSPRSDAVEKLVQKFHGGKAEVQQQLETPSGINSESKSVLPPMDPHPDVTIGDDTMEEANSMAQNKLFNLPKDDPASGFQFDTPESLQVVKETRNGVSGPLPRRVAYSGPLGPGAVLEFIQKVHEGVDNTVGVQLRNKNEESFSSEMEAVEVAYEVFDEMPKPTPTGLLRTEVSFYVSLLANEVNSSLFEFGTCLAGEIEKSHISKLGNVELWIGEVLMFVIDPGGSSRHCKGCSFTESNSVKQTFDKIPSNLSVEFWLGIPYLRSKQLLITGAWHSVGIGVPHLVSHLDGVSWLLNSPQQSLALILADTGFDVWIANILGTRFSRRHVTLDPSQPEYWNWTWDELVIHDLPVVFSFVFKQTGQGTHYVGHFMGILIALASFSEGRQIDKVKSAALLSPIAYLQLLIWLSRNIICSKCNGKGSKSGASAKCSGSNSPEWIMVMEACNCQAVTYVPLYDTLGANAVEYIINHAEVSIVSVQESKIPSILKCLPRCTAHLKTIVSFGIFSEAPKKEAEEFGVSGFSWDEFTLLGNQTLELPLKEKKNICTIMYTSGTTGEPKGVVLNNGAFMAEVLSMDRMLLLTDKVMTGEDSYFSFLPLAHIYDQIMMTYSIHKGSSVGFWQGDVRYLIDDLTELKPTVFSGVPRVYDKIYAGVMQKISAGGALITFDNIWYHLGEFGTILESFMWDPGKCAISVYILEDKDVLKRKGIGIRLAWKQDEGLNGASTCYYTHMEFLTRSLFDRDSLRLMT